MNLRLSLAGFRQNPVILKEMRSRMRGSRAFTLLTLYLIALGLLVSLIYLVFLSSNSAIGSVNDRRILGKAIYGVVVGMELMCVIFIAPGLTAGAISSERERQTYDLLRTTLLSARSLVLGKFTSALAFLILLLLAALPLQSLSFLFGGVAPEEVLIGSLLLLITSIAFSAAGILISSFLSRTTTSTVISYAFAIVLVFGLPFIILIFFSLFNSAVSRMMSSPSITMEVALLFLGWLLVSLNPLSTAIASDIILTEQQRIFTFSFPLSNGASVYLPAPWIIFSLLYVVTSIMLLWISIRRVKRAEK